MRRAVTIPEPPAIQLLGDAVVLRGPAAIDALRLVGRGIEAARREDGILPPPRVEQLLAAIQEAARQASLPMSDSGHADVRNSAVSTESKSQKTGMRVGSKEAAEMLGIGPRQIRRLASELDGRKARGSWTFDLLAVESLQLTRTNAKEVA